MKYISQNDSASYMSLIRYQFKMMGHVNMIVDFEFKFRPNWTLN